MKLTDLPEHIQDLIRKQDARVARAKADREKQGVAPAKRAKALPRVVTLNQTERAFAADLERRRRAGEIADYKAQSMTFLLAPGCRYTPDFFIVENDGTITLVDVKGRHTWEDAVIKFKCAAQTFPWFRWQMIERRGETWHVARDLNGAG